MGLNLREASNQEAVGIAILVLVLIVSPVIIILVRNAVATIQLYAAHLAVKARELKREKRKSDMLLFQMLPPSVAQQLKQTQQVRETNESRYNLPRDESFRLAYQMEKK